jgi:PTS system N-acetylglucosamine-specific IIC component
VDACTTRLRLTVAEQAAVDAAALSRLGARGLVRPAPQALQVVIGPTADRLAGEIREALAGAARAPVVRNAHTPAAAPAVAPDVAVWAARAAPLLAALGGTTNVRSVEAASTRLRVRVSDPRRVNERAVGELGLRGMALPAPGVVHIIVGPEAAAAAAALRHLLT